MKNKRARATIRLATVITAVSTAMTPMTVLADATASEQGENTQEELKEESKVADDTLVDDTVSLDAAADDSGADVENVDVIEDIVVVDALKVEEDKIEKLDAVENADDVIEAGLVASSMAVDPVGMTLMALPAGQRALEALPPEEASEPAVNSIEENGGTKINALLLGETVIDPAKIDEYKENHDGEEPMVSDVTNGLITDLDAAQKTPAESLIIKGDLEVAPEGTESYDSQSEMVAIVEKDKDYTVKAELNIDGIKQTMAQAENAVDQFPGGGEIIGITGMSSIFKATFTSDPTFGTFYVSTASTDEDRIADYQKHYELKAESEEQSDKQIYTIDWKTSSFASDKVSISMLLKNSVFGSDKPDGTPIDSSYYNLVNTVKKSPNLVLLLHNFHVNESTTDETASTIHGTLDGKMSAGLLNYGFPVGGVSFEWGAIQDASGKDSTQDASKHNVQLTMTTPAAPVVPDDPAPVTPSDDPTPVAPSDDPTPASSDETPSTCTDENTEATSTSSTITAPAAPVVLGVTRTETTIVPQIQDDATVLGVERTQISDGGLVLGVTRNVSTGDEAHIGDWGAMLAFATAALAGWYAWDCKRRVN